MSTLMIQTISTFTILAQILVLILIFTKPKINKIRITFCIVLASILGSLYFSEVEKFAPCELCILQRILMIIMAVVLLVAMFVKIKIKDYVLALSSAGLLISGYQYIMQMTNTSNICYAGVSCATQYFVEFNYINIPMMSFTAFALIFVLFIKNN